jgi:hypothetical protein
VTEPELVKNLPVFILSSLTPPPFPTLFFFGKRGVLNLKKLEKERVLRE